MLHVKKSIRHTADRHLTPLDSNTLYSMNIKHDSKLFGGLIHYFLSYEFQFQYPVYQPFALYSASARDGMLKINLSLGVPLLGSTIGYNWSLFLY